MITINEKDFVNWMKVKGLSDRTRHEYLAYLNKLPYQELEQKDVNTFLSVYSNPPARALLKNLLTYIHTSDYFDNETKLKAQDIYLNIPKQSGAIKKTIPSYLTYEEIIMLSNGMNPRNRIMTLLCFTTGLRLKELLDLKYSNFNFKEWFKNPSDTGRCKFIGKRQKESIVSIEPEVMAGILKYIQDSGNRGKDEYVFWSNKTKKIGRSTWAKILRVNGIKILGKPVKPHQIRHSYATYLLSKGFNIMEIKELMRHENISSTEVYLHIDNEKLRQKKSESFNIK